MIGCLPVRAASWLLTRGCAGRRRASEWWCREPRKNPYGRSAKPLYFVQTPREVVLVYSSDEQVRHVYLDVPHSANPNPSWYGESVGHYEGDTLIVDTVALNDKTFIDAFRTPHSEKLHVVERFKLVDGGKAMQVNITLDDPDAFNAPWSLVQRYDRIQGPFEERVCAENKRHLFDYHIPEANKADF
jgi:hypothetical protein